VTLLFATSAQTNPITNWFAANKTEDKKVVSVTNFDRVFAVVSKYLNYFAIPLIALDYNGLQNLIMFDQLTRFGQFNITGRSRMFFGSYVILGLLYTAITSFWVYKTAKIFDYAVQNSKKAEGPQKSENPGAPDISMRQAMFLVVASHTALNVLWLARIGFNSAAPRYYSRAS